MAPSGLEDLFGNEISNGPNIENGDLPRAMVIAGHPDDSDVGAGGITAKLAKAGWEVRIIVATDGSKGSSQANINQKELVAKRIIEQQNASKVLGAKDVKFLDFIDGELEYNRNLIAKITKEIRIFKPYAVYTHDPEAIIINNSFVSHSDHRATGLATVDSVYPTARDPLNFPEHMEEGLETHKVRELFLWGTNQSNLEIDISDYFQKKIDALKEHKSQFDFTDEMQNRFLERWKNDDGKYTEKFRRIVFSR
ncbi:MAG: N-acetylglucosaminyl deacetylase, LmbE family [Chloroflexi bacterium]|jgi:LmbE family N-acetylglucosaminyl deacetylase|nr:MAG: N-acetylglucosaminyl deacetylase, LmbE family [Chloroflexota bacterium]|tara:strand:+ start:1313 stop:2068 length:756 start_codon:yes stop_codon:yes gene_type:complete